MMGDRAQTGHVSAASEHQVVLAQPCLICWQMNAQEITQGFMFAFPQCDSEHQAAAISAMGHNFNSNFSYAL